MGDFGSRTRTTGSIATSENKTIFEQDKLQTEYTGVWMPDVLAQKYPAACLSLSWQYLIPSSRFLRWLLITLAKQNSPQRLLLNLLRNFNKSLCSAMISDSDVSQAMPMLWFTPRALSRSALPVSVKPISKVRSLSACR